MELEKFKAGRFEKGAGYSYFVPQKINQQWVWSDAELNFLLEKASIKLGELNVFSGIVPNIDLFIQMLVTNESTLSSKIEGTNTDLEDAFLPEEEINPEKKLDWHEVKNYTDALNNAIKELENLPLSTRLLKKAHFILLQGVRGENKLPGEFRTSQNWIGGSSISNAAFIPPSHTYVNDLVGDLENFLHNEKIQVPDLIKIGIAHYQFETIHPFLDGNGRIGRLLITLYLVSKKIMKAPLLYLSVFFEKDKNRYYENLTRVREKNDLLNWLKYFLTGIEQIASDSAETLRKSLELQKNLEKKLTENSGRRTQSALKLLNYSFKNPIVQVKEVQTVCELSPKAANDLVFFFVENKIFGELKGQRRNRLFLFTDYLKLFKSYS